MTFKRVIFIGLQDHKLYYKHLQAVVGKETVIKLRKFYRLLFRVASPNSIVHCGVREEEKGEE